MLSVLPEALFDFIERNGKNIEYLEITTVKEEWQNNIVGFEYYINVVVIPVTGYQQKDVKVVINSSYLEDSEDNIDEYLDYFELYINDLAKQIKKKKE